MEIFGAPAKNIKELEDKNQKIENLKEDFRKNHKKLTVNQYDKRLKGINKKEN